MSTGQADSYDNGAPRATDPTTALTDKERATLTKVLANPLDFPTEFRGWLLDIIGTSQPTPGGLANIVATFFQFADYTPVLSGSVSNPSLGTGPTEYGKYIKVGEFVLCFGHLKFGTSINNGSGDYSISLPLSYAGSDGSILIGTGQVYDASANGLTIAHVNMKPSSTTEFEMLFPGTGAPNSNTTIVGELVPFTFATLDELRWIILYETAG